jgi:hypothetical protein
MEAVSEIRNTKNLEEYLLDLICTVNSPEEVGVLVNALMVLQQHPSYLLAKAEAPRIQYKNPSLEELR